MEGRDLVLLRGERLNLHFLDFEGEFSLSLFILQS